MPKILIIEDDPGIVRLVQDVLKLETSFTAAVAADPEDALAEILRAKPDMILLDIMLGGVDGRQILKRLKGNTATARIPVIIISALDGGGDKVLGLDLGADDYLPKPFDSMELMSRIRAVLRRSQPQRLGSGVLEDAELKLDADNRSVSFKDKPIRLRPKEFEILYLLASHPGRVLSRSYLIENSSSYGMEVSTRSLDTHIKNIRQKLGGGARLIETVPKLGYRFNRRKLTREE